MLQVERPPCKECFWRSKPFSKCLKCRRSSKLLALDFNYLSIVGYIVLANVDNHLLVEAGVLGNQSVSALPFVDRSELSKSQSTNFKFLRKRCSRSSALEELHGFLGRLTCRSQLDTLGFQLPIQPIGRLLFALVKLGMCI